MLPCPPVEVSRRGAQVLFGDHRGLPGFPSPLFEAVATRLTDNRDGLHVMTGNIIQFRAPRCRISLESLTLVSTSPENTFQASPVAGMLTTLELREILGN